MKTSNDLRDLLKRIDHRSYPAYKDTKGSYQFRDYVLSIDHVQGDPFASPSGVSVHISGKKAGFPSELYDKDYKRIALQDYLIRKFYQITQRFAFLAKGSGKSGLIAVSRCGQEILERSACEINARTGDVLVRLEIGFPANGRTINAGELTKILFDYLPECAEKTLFYKNCDQKAVRQVKELAEDQRYIREQLKALGLVAFVANGAVLPRESGVSSRPMKNAVAFVSPKEMEVSLDLPNKGKITGMGIRQGITLIVGGGYHGKSTLLKALELGVYDHIAGDGREYVITDASAVKIRAEDGRSIKKTDISMFINDLPNGKDTQQFETEDASGSTSQAANVIEAMEAGSKTLLIDEDTSATNFMVRDELMQRVIHRDMEPITPFIDRAAELYDRYHISTVLVAGSSGAYFHIADTIIQMEQYVPREITALAKKEAKNFPAMQGIEPLAKAPRFDRCPKQNRDFLGNDRIKMKTMGREGVQINREHIDLRGVEQLTDSEQTAALGYLMIYAGKHCFGKHMTVQEIVDQLTDKVSGDGLVSICGVPSGITGLAMPRKQEIFACLNRCRGLLLL